MLCSDHWHHRRIRHWKTPWSLRHHFFRNLAGDDREHDCVDDQNERMGYFNYEQLQFEDQATPVALYHSAVGLVPVLNFPRISHR